MTQTFEEIVSQLDDLEVPEEPRKGETKKHFSHPTRQKMAWCGVPLPNMKTGSRNQVPGVECEQCMYLLRTIGSTEYYYQRGFFGLT